MKQIDFCETYRRAIDELVGDITQRDQLFELAFEYDKTQNLNVDNGRSAIFARCYEATMAYLQTVQDIKEKHKDKLLTHDEYVELLEEAEKIRDAGRIMFNGMVNSDIYINQPNMRHFREFWNTFYNNTHNNVLDISKFTIKSLDEAHDVLAKKEKVIMSDPQFGEACFKFASANEFAKMVRLACSIEPQQLHEFKDFLPGIEERIDAISEQCAIESRLTSAGFVTHNAFALQFFKTKDGVDIRDNKAQSAERYVLSSPAIHNKISQETNHAGFGKIKICSITAQRTHGIPAGREHFMDTVRAFCSCGKSGTQLANNAATILKFCVSADEQSKKSMEKLIEEFDKKLKEKMPQTTIGKQQRQIKPGEASLYVMLLDAKAEQFELSPLERYERSAMRDVIDSIVSHTKDCLETLIKDKTYEFDLNKELSSYEVQLFDRWRYDNIQGLPDVDGSGGAATLKLITHMMANGDIEHQKDLILYNQTIDFLTETFGKDLAISDVEQDFEIDRK